MIGVMSAAALCPLLGARSRAALDDAPAALHLGVDDFQILVFPAQAKREGFAAGENRRERIVDLVHDRPELPDGRQLLALAETLLRLAPCRDVLAMVMTCEMSSPSSRIGILVIR